MSYKLVIEIGRLPRAISPNARVHWAVRAKENREFKFMVVMLARSRGVPRSPLKQAKLTFTRYSSRQPDDDNLVASFKAVRDGLKEAGVILDDNAKVLSVRPDYRWEYAKAGKGKIKIEVEEILD